jgi:uncharacterized protein YjdB
MHGLLHSRARFGLIAALGLAGCSSGYSTPDPSVILWVVVTAPSNYVTVGQTLQLTATGYNGNNVVVGGANFRWSSPDPTIATVDQNGLATGVGTGMVYILAQTGSVPGYMPLPVIARDGG